jgi:hypothetical protein
MDKAPKFVDQWFDEMYESGEYECMDNYRWAEVGDAFAEEDYEGQKASGCCGSHDTVITGPDGSRFRVGFNYGH